MNNENNSNKIKNNNTSNEMRKIIIENYIGQKSLKEISQIFKINLSTVQSIIRIYINENRIEKKPRGGNKRSILTDCHKEAIKNYIDENITISLLSIKNKFLNEYSNEFSNISISTIRRAIKGFHYTLKRISYLPITRNTISLINQRFTYGNLFNEKKITYG